ncbi:MAG: hypothetical protein Q8P84_02950 [Deltaproteobacteria bacterium]|nr:hypothetical protein [Deltaproteobacteria bacterium]
MMMTLPSAMQATVQKTADKPVACSLCGFQFNRAEAACGGCTLYGGCGSIKCPNCGFEFVTESKLVNWFTKLLDSGWSLPRALTRGRNDKAKKGG